VASIILSILRLFIDFPCEILLLYRVSARFLLAAKDARPDPGDENEMPSEEDFAKLCGGVLDMVKVRKAALDRKKSRAEWRDLASVVLVYLIIFNGKWNSAGRSLYHYF
jgi:hypothetical protein